MATENRYASIYIDGNAANDTLASLRKESQRLKNELDKLPRSSAEFADRAKRLQEVEARLKSLREEARGVGTAFGNMKGELDKAGKGGFMSLIPGNIKSLLGWGAAATAAMDAARRIITQNAELSDSFAAVMKTTGLTQVEVEQLDRSLGKLNTRTAKKELLDLASVAGKLGITGVKNVEGFVRAADKIGVALGADLGGTEAAVEALGKLTDIFKITDDFTIEDSLLKVGSAINSLGAAGAAKESDLIDFSTRLAGIAPAADVALSKVLGLGATLSELGQRTEMSTTAIGQFWVEMGGNATKFAKIAGMSVKDFSALMKSDMNEAFLRVLEKSNAATGGIEQLALGMKSMEVKNSGAIQALGALAGNIDKVREKQALANEEFDAGTSIMTEFNTVNSTLGGNMEKIWNRLGMLWENGTVRSGLTRMTAGIVDWLDKLRGVDNTVSNATASYTQHKASMEAVEGEVKNLLGEYDRLKTKTSLNKDEQLKLKDTIDQLALMVPEAINQWDNYGRAMDINRVKVENFGAAQRKLFETRAKDDMKDVMDLFNKSVQAAGNWQKRMEKDSKMLASGKLDVDDVLAKRQKESISQRYGVADEKRTLEMGKAYDAAVAWRDVFKQPLTPAMEKIIKFFEGKPKPVVASGGDATQNGGGGNTGGGDKKKGKTDAEREAERAKEMHARLLKEDKTFKDAMALSDASWYEKEIAAEQAKYDKQIDNWKEFLAKKGVTPEQKTEAEGKIKGLEDERDNVAIPKLRIKLEEEAVKGINKLRESMGEKLKTELEREAKLINEHYDGLKEKYAGNTEMLATIEKNRATDLSNAKIREEERFHKESEQLRQQAELSKLTGNDRELAEITLKYDAEIEALREKYSQELLLKEEFDAAIDDINARRQAELDERELKREQDKREAIKGMAIDIAQSTADALASIISANNEQELSNKLSAIDRMRQTELRAVNLTEAQKKAINDRYDAMERKEKEKAWKAQQKADIVQAGINTALAVTRALPNWINAAAVGAAGLLQMAVIASKPVPQFYHGGYTAEEPGGWVRKPTIFQSASGKQFSAGENSMGEYVISSDQLRDPLVADFVSMMEANRTNQIGGIMAPQTTIVQQGADNSRLEGLMVQMVDAFNASQDKKVVMVFSEFEEVRDKKVSILNQANV